MDGDCERDVFTTLRDMGKVCVIVACPTLTTRRFSHSLSQIRVSRCYKTQWRFTGCCTCIPPTTVMQLLRQVWKFQWHMSLIRVSPDPFPIFEDGVRQRQTISIEAGKHACVQLQNVGRGAGAFRVQWWLLAISSLRSKLWPSL